MEPFSDDLKEEIIEALNFTVNSGYYNQKDKEELATEYLEEIFSDYDLEQPSQDLIKKLLTEIETRQPAQPRNNHYGRLRAVFDQLNRERIIAIDYAGFDRSEGHEEVGTVFQFMKEHHIPRKGYCFYHQQDIERSMSPSNQSLFLAFHSTDGDEKQVLLVGKRVVELLNEANFTVSWNGTLAERICIQPFIWDKILDNEDVGTERALRIIREANLS